MFSSFTDSGDLGLEYTKNAGGSKKGSNWENYNLFILK